MARRKRRKTPPDVARPNLPEDLAPALRERVEALLCQVPPARLTRSGAGPARRKRRVVVNRCAFCHRPGKLGDRHDERTGELVWVHNKCYRRHHRAHRRTRRGDRWWRTRVARPRSC